jgi:hydrogenase nickel incorporation protein HypA/HybF
LHELSVCQSLLSQVEKIAAQNSARSVALIKLRIGPLAGIEPELLRHAFTIASAGTIAEATELLIEALPVRVRCQECQAESEVEPNQLTCKQCGSWRTQLTSGDEMLLASLELLSE